MQGLNLSLLAGMTRDAAEAEVVVAFRRQPSGSSATSRRNDRHELKQTRNVKPDGGNADIRVASADVHSSARQRTATRCPKAEF